MGRERRAAPTTVPSGSTSAGAPANEGNLEFARQFHQRRYLFGVPGEDHQVGRVFIHPAIVFIERQIFGPVQVALRSQQRGNAGT